MDRDVSLPTEATPCEGNARQNVTPVCVPAVRRRQRLQQRRSEEGSTDLEEPTTIAPEVAGWIKRCAQELKIRKADRSWAAEVVNDFRDNLLKFLKRNPDPFLQSAELLTTGSYFEKVKIHSPDEFDMMLKFQVPAPLTMTQLDDGLFYRLDFNRSTRSSIKGFLLENGLTLSSSKVLNEMHCLVRKFVKTYEVPDRRCKWEVNRKRPNSPAVTLSLCRKDSSSDELISVDVVPALEVHSGQAWPQPARNGPDVDNWLGKKVRIKIKRQPCIFVPKRLKGQKVSKDAKESWRISFSVIEKDIIAKHGNSKTCCEANGTKCCRKQCLMLLKSLIEGLKQRFPKELENLCSYHGKTTFLHTLSVRFEDNMWSHKQLPVCFLHLLGALEKYARQGVLPHFFVPNCNLFSTNVFPHKALAFLVHALEEQRREGLPLLKPPAPVSPLRPIGVIKETSTKEPSPASAAYTESENTRVNYTGIMVMLAVTLGLCVLYII